MRWWAQRSGVPGDRRLARVEHGAGAGRDPYPRHPLGQEPPAQDRVGDEVDAVGKPEDRRVPQPRPGELGQPDPADRRRVVVRALTERAEADLGPPYAALTEAMDRLADRYGDADLAVVLDYMERAGAIAAEQIARIRAEAGAGAAPGRGRGVRSWGRRQVPPP